MGIYSTIYYNLCEKRKTLKEAYYTKSYSQDLHRHHIIPRHSNGTDDESNLTYLTVREHVLAHYLLWKIHKNPNDLRSMQMLGANLTYAQRKAVGEWCRDNKIGFFSASEEDRKAWRQKGIETQKQSGDTNSWYWWSTEEGRKKRASLGGKASIESGNNKEWLYWMSPEGRTERGKLGAKASAKKPVTNGVITKKFKTNEEVETFLLINPDWRKGVHPYKKGPYKKKSLKL